MKYQIKSDDFASVSLYHDPVDDVIQLLIDDMVIAWLNDAGELEMNTYAEWDEERKELEKLGMSFDNKKRAIKVVYG